MASPTGVGVSELRATFETVRKRHNFGGQILLKEAQGEALSAFEINAGPLDRG